MFNRKVLVEALANEEDDFGKQIIPALLQKYKVFAYIFQGYWEDIGTVRAFFEANLALTDLIPPYNFFNRLQPIYTRPHFLPASKINGATIRQAIVADGCIISDANIERAVIGIRSVIENGPPFAIRWSWVPIFTRTKQRTLRKANQRSGSDATHSSKKPSLIKTRGLEMGLL
jgi:ADP-glucose pyrophosphorylase